MTIKIADTIDELWKLACETAIDSGKLSGAEMAASRMILVLLDEKKELVEELNRLKAAKAEETREDLSIQLRGRVLSALSLRWQSSSTCRPLRTRRR